MSEQPSISRWPAQIRMYQRWLDEQLEKLGEPKISDSEMRRAAVQLGYTWTEIDVNSEAAILRSGKNAAWFWKSPTIHYRIVLGNQTNFVPYIKGGEPYAGTWTQEAIDQILSELLPFAGYYTMTASFPIPDDMILPAGD